jgi:ATP phosphoribosyltransferase regulatory subunit
LEKASEAAEPSMNSDAQAILEQLFALEGPLQETPNLLRAFMAQTKLPLEASVLAFEQRLADFSKAGLDVSRMHFAASFDRPLDYYTGLMFEIYSEGQSLPVAAGGRYDKLARLLGAEVAIPAVGAAVWLERLNVKGAV